MSTNQDSPEEPQTPNPPRFQFGIAALLWVMLISALVLTIVLRLPSVVAIPVILFISMGVLPAVWTTLIIYGRGYRRTFGIGAMFPAGICLFFALIETLVHGPNFYRWSSPSAILGVDEFAFRFEFCGFWASSLLVGVVCMGVRRLVEKRPDSRKQ